MGLLKFGKQESLQCLADVPLKGPDGEALCLGYRTSGFYLGAGLYFADDGYVLAARDGASDYCSSLSAEELHAYQMLSLLPDPLPGYRIPASAYVGGYLFWLLAAGLVAGWLARLRHRARS